MDLKWWILRKSWEKNELLYFFFTFLYVKINIDYLKALLICKGIDIVNLKLYTHARMENRLFSFISKNIYEYIYIIGIYVVIYCYPICYEYLL